MPEISKKGKFLRNTIAVALILIGAILRLLPHPPNFAPIGAIALFGGTYLPKRTAFFLPIAAMVISDLFIGYYEIGLMISVYGSFLICAFLGFWLKKHKKWQTILGASIFASFTFFLITNFAVWLFTPWYQKSLFGLIQCYIMALPFFRNTLFGDLFYTAAFFGVYEIIEVWIKKKFTIPSKNFIFLGAHHKI